MKPIIGLFSPMFFVAIGLSLDLKSINWSSSLIWTLTSSILLVAILGKLLAGFFLIGERLKTKLSIGTSMIPRGEVGLIFANNCFHSFWTTLCLWPKRKKKNLASRANNSP
jgi:Kef-type K+ transport system membrane component KefB